MTTHDDVHQCDTGCGRPAPHTWVCWDCVDDTRADLDGFTDTDHATLLMVARRQAASAEPKPATHRGKPAPATPVNIPILQLNTDLTRTWPAELVALPHHEDAAHRLQIIRSGIGRARLILDGPEPEHRTLADAPPLRPMPPTEAAAWLGDTYGYKVTAHRIRVWASRGKLQADHRGRYHPLDLTAVAAEHCT